MNIRSISAFGIALLILGILASTFYIRRMNTDLAAVRKEVTVANEQLQTLRASLTAAEQAKDAALAAQAALDAQLAEAHNPQQGSTANTAMSPDEMNALRHQLSEAQAALQHARKISGYWRDLFDYTKPTRTMLSAQKSASGRSGPMSGAAAAVVN
jgi:chromosome segregation ATPase